MSETFLPNDWKLTRLGDVATYLNGRAFKPIEWKEVGKPIIRIQNLNKADAKYNYSPEKYEDKYKVVKGDLLFAWSASLGAYIWKGDEAWLNQHIFKVVPKEFTEKKYLYYILDKLVHELYSKAHGSGMVHVTKGKFEETKIPLPPKPVQQAIVSKIEELFSELDKGIENLRLAQQQLKTYRQSVLRWAFEGKLTSAEENLLHIGVEPLSMAAEEEEKYRTKLPKGWKWKQSGELFDFVTSGSRGWAKYYSTEGSIFIRITNLDFDCLELDLQAKKIQYVKPPSSTEGIRTKVQEGDFLFSMTGYLGMFAIAPKLENAYVNQHIGLCRPKQSFNKDMLAIGSSQEVEVTTI